MNTAAKHVITTSLKQYIYPLLLEIQFDKCAMCNEYSDYFEIDHIRYNESLTVYDLQLLCHSCHKLKTLDAWELHQLNIKHCPTCTCGGH